MICSFIRKKSRFWWETIEVMSILSSHCR